MLLSYLRILFPLRARQFGRREAHASHGRIDPAASPIFSELIGGREEPSLQFDGSREGNESGQRIITALESITEQPIFERLHSR